MGVVIERSWTIQLCAWGLVCGGSVCWWMSRWWRRSSSFLLSAVAEVTSESLVSALDGGGGVGLASIDDGSSALGP